ncbi:YcjX family protein [Siccirubricoccus deserti]
MFWFFPLPHPVRGDLAALMARRHAAYVEAQRVEFFEPFFRRFDRQAVLVDVLGALHAGPAAFADTAEAIAAIAGALRYGGGWLDRLTGAGVARVAFVATKADHVPARQRDALAALLGHLVAAPQERVGTAGVATSVHTLASIRCTEDAVATLEGRPVAAVRGVLPGGRVAKVYPGEIPLRPPEPGFWEHGFFEMPEFNHPGSIPPAQPECRTSAWMRCWRR